MRGRRIRGVKSQSCASKTDQPFFNVLLVTQNGGMEPWQRSDSKCQQSALPTSPAVLGDASRPICYGGKAHTHTSPAILKMMGSKLPHLFLNKMAHHPFL